MSFFKIFHRPKPKQYRYFPRFYDPDKEDLERRLRNAKGSMGNDTEALKARISSGLRNKHLADRNFKKKLIIRSNLILFGSIVVLLILTYYLLTKYLPSLIQILE